MGNAKVEYTSPPERLEISKIIPNCRPEVGVYLPAILIFCYNQLAHLIVTIIFFFQDIRSIIFATSEEMETPYMTTYSSLVHGCADPIIDKLDGILQRGSIIVFIDHPTEYMMMGVLHRLVHLIVSRDLIDSLDLSGNLDLMGSIVNFMMESLCIYLIISL